MKLILAPLLTSLVGLTGCTFTFISTTGGTASGSAPANTAVANNQQSHTPARPRRVTPAQPATPAQPTPPPRTRIDVARSDRPTPGRSVRVPSNPGTSQPVPMPRTTPTPPTKPVPVRPRPTQPTPMQPTPMPPTPTEPAPTVDTVTGFVFGRPAQVGTQNGFWLYQETTGWHLRTAATDRPTPSFGGRILLQEGAFIFARAVNPAHRDRVKLTSREITFDWDTNVGADGSGVDFDFSGASCVEFELRYQGQLDPSIVQLGLNQVHPKSARFKICK